MTRSWLAFAAIGTGLIHLALVINSPLPIAIVLAAFGIVELGWGVLTFAKEQIIAPRVVLIAATAPIVAWSLLVVAATVFEGVTVVSSLGVFPLAVATLFELFIACVIAVHLRRTTDGKATPKTIGAGRYLLGVMVGAFAVSVLTTPALAATAAGLYAQPHGEHSNSFQPEQTPGHTPEQGEPLQFTVPGHGAIHP